jgi:pyrroline-5-carboxylate reductase
MLKGKRLGVIGAGKLGEAIVAGLLRQGELHREDVIASVKHAGSIDRVRERLGVRATTDNREVVTASDVILLAVKPQNMDSVVRDVSDIATADKIFISVAASVTTSFIQERLTHDVPVVRAMPNTPSLINAGMTALCGGLFARREHLQTAEAIFKCVGETVFVDEHLMDGVTALSASGPAYLYVVVESLAEAGVKLGIPRDVSTLLAAQTMLGAARMVLESKAHPALLKDAVTTPAGCTIDGLMELEEGKLRVTLIKCVVKAAERARELVHG